MSFPQQRPFFQSNSFDQSNTFGQPTAFEPLPSRSLDATVSSLIDQASRLLDAFIANPTPELGGMLERLHEKIADLGKKQGDVATAIEETERQKQREITFRFQNANWLASQQALYATQSQQHYWNQQTAMSIAHNNGLHNTFQALVQHCPQVVSNILASPLPSTNSGV